jgi:transposase
MRPYREITDDQWRQILPMLPESLPRKDPRGRPLSNTRSVLNGVLWVLCSGSSWASMPRGFPPYQTCHRRFKAWHDEGVLEYVVQLLFGAASEEAYMNILSRMRTSRERTGTTRPPMPVGYARHRFSVAKRGEARVSQGK